MPYVTGPFRRRLALGASSVVASAITVLSRLAASIRNR